MARRKLVAKTVSEKDPKQRTPFVLRFDPEIYESLQVLAKSANVSVNQLMEGLATWAVQNVRCGEPEVDADGRVTGMVDREKCFWAGVDDSAEEKLKRARNVWLRLDFSARGAVRN